MIATLAYRVSARPIRAASLEPCSMAALRFAVFPSWDSCRRKFLSVRSVWFLRAVRLLFNGRNIDFCLAARHSAAA